MQSRNGGVINTPHAAFLSAWKFWKPRVAFWKHHIWAKHPDTKEFATAGFNLDDNVEAKITGYLAAFQVKPEEPIISFALSSLYLRQSDPNEALLWAQRATQLCRNDKPAPHDCLAQYLLLQADIYNALGSWDITLDKYNQAVELGNTTALDLLASHYARMGDARSLTQWLGLYLKYEDGSGDDRGNNFANAVLRQPVFSEWHTTFGRAVMELKQPGLQIEAYTKAIRLDKAKSGTILTQCGCRFHLARALARWPSLRAKAIPLWTWILNNVTRSRFFQRRQDSAINWLFLFTIEELSLSQALTLDHPLVSFAENIELSLFDYSRILVCLGKSIEQQRHLSEAAGQLYRRVLRRVLNISRQAGFTFDTCRTLGNILLALGNLDDAARALSWSCIYGDPDDGKIPFDSNVSSTSENEGSITEDETKLVSAQTTVKATSKPQSLHMRVSWGTLCDMCAAKRNYSTDVDIFGYRYKCCICSEVDLCELCYVDWKDSGDKEMHEAMRHCEPSHTFLKLPSPLWPEVEWEARQIRARQMPESVRAWLDELVVKYDLQDHR
jgi:tetratricopeptide (TPR) repeat protein